MGHTKPAAVLIVNPNAGRLEDARGPKLSTRFGLASISMPTRHRRAQQRNCARLRGRRGWHRVGHRLRWRRTCERGGQRPRQQHDSTRHHSRWDDERVRSFAGGSFGSDCRAGSSRGRTETRHSRGASGPHGRTFFHLLCRMRLRRRGRRARGAIRADQAQVWRGVLLLERVSSTGWKLPAPQADDDAPR